MTVSRGIASQKWEKPPLRLPGAACLNHPELDWFPNRGALQDAAKAVCWNECAHRIECLNYAIRNGEKFGIWGGISERGRRKLRVEEHGTHADYQRHMRRKETPCDACRNAHRIYRAELRQRREDAA